MISNVGLKGYKTMYGFLVPILWVVAVICGTLCCFRAEEGSNSRIICAVLLICSLVLIGLLKLIDQKLDKTNAYYHIYQSPLVKKMDPGVMIPLCLMVVVVALPFYILVVTSIKTPLEANSLDFSWWPKEGIDLASYKELFSYGGSIGITMGQAVLNSFIYAIVPTVIGVFVAALSAYSFAKLKFPGRDLMYHLLIMTMMMPGCVTMTTSYIMFDWYGWTDSALPLIVPGCFSAAATVMFLREFFMGIPDGLLEAAKIDGAGKWKAFLLIVLPIGKPALMAQLVLGFISKYNDFLTPLIYLNNPRGYTIQVALDFLNNSVQDKSLVASAGVFSLVTMLLLYVIFQKRIIDGISMSSGLKG
ncbi:MAG: carbohydrate ABC transporter permease [Tyzzerella sp.]|nr:carbohydrate ABC transporter permease [Tyzzerella sp.]